MAKTVHLYPSQFGIFLDGVPAIEVDVSPDQATVLVASGAFQYDPPPKDSPDVESIEPTEV